LAKIPFHSFRNLRPYENNNTHINPAIEKTILTTIGAFGLSIVITMPEFESEAISLLTLAITAQYSFHPNVSIKPLAT